MEQRWRGGDWRIVAEELIQHPIRQIAAMGGEILEYEATESEWIKIEKMVMGGHFEEFVGIRSRYTLTDKAKDVLAKQQA